MKKGTKRAASYQAKRSGDSIAMLTSVAIATAGAPTSHDAAAPSVNIIHRTEKNAKRNNTVWVNRESRRFHIAIQAPLCEPQTSAAAANGDIRFVQPRILRH